MGLLRGLLHDQKATLRAANAHSVPRFVQFCKYNNVIFLSIYAFSFGERSLRSLPFDFYLQDYNVLIEIDGIQHFRPTQFANQTKEQLEESFAKQKKHDAIKDSYCKKYNIPLLRISYLEIRNNKFKDKILNFIKE